MISPCILLPTYNNKSTVGHMVNKLLKFEMPIVIVNDGSDMETSTVVDRLTGESSFVSVVHRRVNGGKGAAVWDGLRWAKENGYSHVVQLDADDQHCIDDIPRFVAVAKESPDTFVLGQPIFSNDVPLGRLIGRQISRFWVVLETLSFKIKDPLYGFRLYPVDSTLELLHSVSVGKRMDFDPEIAVRLYWKGLSVYTIQTPVAYPPGGISSFRMFRDNVRISWMHTRLFCGMFFRIPFLVKRWFSS